MNQNYEADRSHIAFDALAERAIREHWEFLPTAGSRIGRGFLDIQTSVSGLWRDPR